MGLDTRRSQERGARPQAREAGALPTSQSGSRADWDRRPPPAALQGGSGQGLQAPRIHPESDSCTRGAGTGGPGHEAGA